MYFTLLFGEINQMTYVLKQNFRAKHLWVKSKEIKNQKIDAMFFPSLLSYPEEDQICETEDREFEMTEVIR
jgi:hypothetical protein